MKYTKKKIIAGVISLQSFSQKLNFILGEKMLCKHYPEMKPYESKLCACEYKGNIQFELLLQNSNCNQASPAKETKYLLIAFLTKANNRNLIHKRQL